MSEYMALAMAELRESEKGQELRKLAKTASVNMMFDYEGERNPEVFEAFEPAELFDAVIALAEGGGDFKTLTLSKDGVDYDLDPYFKASDAEVVVILQDSMSATLNVLLESHIDPEDAE